MSPLRDESGFTLTELLVAMTVGLVVLFGALGLLETTTTLSAKTTDRVEATAGARKAMDLITRQIRSQICMSGDPPRPALIAATPDSMTFYASLAPASDVLAIQRRTVQYVPGAAGDPGKITETVETGANGRPDPSPWSAPTTRLIADSVVRDGSKPLFTYYKLEDNTASANYGKPVPIPSAASLALGERQRTAQVEVNFAVKGRSKSSIPVALSNTAYVRTSNPTKPELSPVCL